MMHSAFALIPGQRFYQVADPSGSDEPVEVALVDRDPLGTPRVTFRYRHGREVTAYVGQVRAALAAGLLVPADMDEAEAA